jgi:hypothetical protein
LDLNENRHLMNNVVFFRRKAQFHHECRYVLVYVPRPRPDFDLPMKRAAFVAPFRRNHALTSALWIAHLLWFWQVALSTGSIFAGWLVLLSIWHIPALIIPRWMRRTGKLYTLTLVSSLLTILASVLVVLWNENSSAFHLWGDIIPHGFGMASLITTTLIVCSRFLISLPAPLKQNFQAMIASVNREDMAVATGSELSFAFWCEF